MYTFDMSNIINIVISISLYFTIACLGSFTKDLYNSITKRDEKIQIKRILVGGIFATFIMLWLEGYILEHYGINSLVFLGYMIGGVGFELFGKWVNVNTIEGVLKDKFFKQ